VLAEFGPDLEILLACSTGETRKTTLAALLPDAFASHSLPKKGG